MTELEQQPDPYAELYRRYFPLVREKCRRMLPNAHEAQDVAQETLVRLWKSNAMNLPPAQLTVWLYRTSTRLAIDALRRRAQASGLSADELAPSPSPLPDSVLDQRRLLAQVARRVPAKELEVALLHRVDGLTQPELAQVLGLSDRTVRRLLTKVDARLERLRAEAA